MTAAACIKRLFAALLLLALPACAPAQQVTLKGKVTDESRQPIPYCAIEDTALYTGVLCDAEGRFSITLNAAPARGLTFYATGYDTKVLQLSELAAPDSVTVTMTGKGHYLQDIVVTGARARIKERVLGKKHQRHKGGCYMQYGDEVAIFLDNSGSTRTGYLKEINLYITNEGAPASKFRVHVYKKDQGIITPGRELGQLMAHATLGNEWVTADVSTLRIPTTGGVFISVEWTGRGNSRQQYTYDATQSWYIAHPGPEGETDHAGQVLGTTWGYGRTDRTFYKYKGGQWEYWGNDAARRELRKTPGRHWFNPMIYGTYTYSRK